MRRSMTITLPIPPETVMTWFTPEGERAWAGPGWDPHYPQPDRQVGPGAVFITHAHIDEARTVWVMVNHQPARVCYARVTPEAQAGTVSVEVVDSGEDWSSVEVTYDLSALSEHGAEALDRFSRGYDEEIRGWQTAIEKALGPSQDPAPPGGM